MKKVSVPFLICLLSEAKLCRKSFAGTTLNCRWYSGLRMASVRNVSVTYLWKYVGNGSSESRSYTSVLQLLPISSNRMILKRNVQNKDEIDTTEDNLYHLYCFIAAMLAY